MSYVTFIKLTVMKQSMSSSLSVKGDILGMGDYYLLDTGRWVKGSRGCSGFPDPLLGGVNGEATPLPSPDPLTNTICMMQADTQRL